MLEVPYTIKRSYFNILRFTTFHKMNIFVEEK